MSRPRRCCQHPGCMAEPSYGLIGTFGVRHAILCSDHADFSKHEDVVHNKARTHGATRRVGLSSRVCAAPAVFGVEAPSHTTEAAVGTSRATARTTASRTTACPTARPTTGIGTFTARTTARTGSSRGNAGRPERVSFQPNFRPKTGRRQLKAKKRGAPPVKAATLVPLTVRARVDPRSRKVGSLLAGSIVYVLETRRLESSGVCRVKVAVARDNAPPKGWVNASSADGKQWYVEFDGGAGAERIVWRNWAPSKPSAASGGESDDVEVREETINLSVRELNSLATSQLQLASEADGWKLGADTLGARVGKALHVQGIDVDEYLRKYVEKEGEVSAAVVMVNRMEFRRSVRALLKPSGGSASADEADDLFRTFDKDGSWELEIPELRAAFLSMRRSYTHGELVAAMGGERGARLRALADGTQAASRVTLLAQIMETEASHAAQAKSKPDVPPSPVERLAGLLAKSDVDVGCVIKRWAKQGEAGFVLRSQVVQTIRSLGLKLTSEESEELVRQLDSLAARLPMDAGRPAAAAGCGGGEKGPNPAAAEGNGGSGGSQGDAGGEDGDEGTNEWMRISHVGAVLTSLQADEREAVLELASLASTAKRLRDAARAAQFAAYRAALEDERKRAREDRLVVPPSNCGGEEQHHHQQQGSQQAAS